MSFALIILPGLLRLLDLDRSDVQLVFVAVWQKPEHLFLISGLKWYSVLVVCLQSDLWPTDEVCLVARLISTSV